MTLQANLDATPPSTPLAAPLPPPTWDRASFWQFAEAAKEATEALAAHKMAMLPALPIEALRQVCTQYRFFTIDYITDLAVLVARLPSGGLRSLLARILSEELGDGDPALAHPEVYDRFLASLGVPAAQLDRCLPANRAILDGLSDALASQGVAFGVGLRGMGGECLCQTYLATLYEHLRAHPYVRAHEQEIDWTFWTIHAGEQDILHGELTRKAIDDYLRETPDAVAGLARGYEYSITAWNGFWDNIFASFASDAGGEPRAMGRVA